jgi:hypothetical protein
MANGGTYVQNGFDLFALEDLVFAGATAHGGIVLALGLKHRSNPPVAGGIHAGAARSMPTAAALVKPGDGAAATPSS